MAKQKQSRTLETAFNTYTLERVIGEGGAGRVWQAVDSSSSKVAIKVLNPDRATTERRKRFKNEILFCQANVHPNIVRVIAYGVDESSGTPTPFYVMPFFQHSLRQVLSEKRGHQLLPLFDGILSGVGAAHLKGVIHRDLKPENVLVDGQSVVVADFGTAHFADEELFTLVETAPNTRTANVIYAAPEQKARGRRVDHRADIFALGLMLNEIFTGEVIHAPGYQKVATVASGYAWVDEIVAEMIDTDPNKRPQTIDAVKQLLGARQQDYVQRQRLSQIQHTVIPVGEEDDPLALQPPKLVDFEFEGNRLTLVVDRDVNQGWIQAFNTMNPGTAVLGKPPTAFHWSGRRATVSAQEYQVQPIINYFKDWMPIATTTYRQMRERERSTTAQREHAKLAAEQEEIQRQLRLKKNIKL